MVVRRLWSESQDGVYLGVSSTKILYRLGHEITDAACEPVAYRWPIAWISSESRAYLVSISSVSAQVSCTEPIQLSQLGSFS